MSEQPGRYQRSAAGMVGAMLVLVLVVVAFVVFRDLNRNDLPSPVQPVDYAKDARFAREQADFDLVAPAQLPDGWEATSVRFSDGPDAAWHIGFLTGAGRYVGLEQSASSVRSMVEMHVDPEPTRAGTARIAGDRWVRWRDDGGDVALVRRTGGTTTLVVGHEVPQDDLASFVESLRRPSGN